MLGILLAPEFLALDSFLSMNSFEPVFWMTCVLAILMLLRGASSRWWIVFGIAGGIGLENKPSMVVFLVALLIGLLLTPQRRLVFTVPRCIGVALIVVLALPNLLWQIHNHFPTLEFLHNGKVDHKNTVLSPLQFLVAQVLMMSPFSVFLWFAGLVWLLVSRRSRQWRFLGWTYVVFLVLMFATRDAKDYYLAPIYPAIFAAGGVCWQALLEAPQHALACTRLRSVSPHHRHPGSAYVHADSDGRSDGSTTPRACTFGARQRARRTSPQAPSRSSMPTASAGRRWSIRSPASYNGLSPADRARVGILCSNYGEASAINFLGAGRGLPFAISGHNNYWIWGPHGETGDVMIVINGASLDEMRKYYDSVEIAGVMDHPYAMPFEHRNIYLCRGRKGSVFEGLGGIQEVHLIHRRRRPLDAPVGPCSCLILRSRCIRPFSNSTTGRERAGRRSNGTDRPGRRQREPLHGHGPGRSRWKGDP